MAQRSDAPLIRHLAQTYGPETARDWQRPPLVVLPGAQFRRYLRDHGKEFIDAIDDFSERPWRDCVLDFAGGTDDMPVNGLYSIGWWARLRSVEDLLASNDPLLDSRSARESLLDLVGAQAHRWLAMDMWEWVRTADDRRAFNRHAHRVYSEPWLGGKYACGLCGDATCPCTQDEDEYKKICSHAFAVCLGTMAYLRQCNEHLVEVAPKARKPLPPNQLKVQEAKPWLKETLPHYILLDPMRVQEYGHPSAQRAPVGHHAPPRPHTRRGHWAVLQHERFQRNEDGTPRRVWIKQAWVGATEWDYLDQRYRVVLPKVDQKTG